VTKRITLGEVVKVDRTVATAQQSKELAYVGLEHIEKISGHFDPYYIAVSAELLATKFVFTPDHVLLGKLRPNLGKVVRPNFTGICSTDILPLLPKTGILDRTYLWGLLLTQKFTKWASNNVTGANLPRLDPKLLVEYSFDLPAFAEQKIIAARLTKADRIRRLRRAALDQSESAKQPS
jgi:type I restriction enzyme S subunit